MDRDQVRVDQAQALQPLERAHAVLPQAVLDFVPRFVHVAVDRQSSCGGQRGDRSKVLSATVYGAWGARQKEIRGSSRKASRAASPLAR